MVNYNDYNGNRILFICDRLACDNCNDPCTHTSDISHARNRKIFEEDPVRFLFNRCTAMCWYNKMPYGRHSEVKCVEADHLSFWEKDETRIADNKEEI